MVRWESWMGFSMRVERVLQYGERVEWVFRWGLNGSYSTVRELNEFFDEGWTGPTVRWESLMSFSMRIERVLQYGERVEWVFRWGLNGSYSTVRELNGFFDEGWTGPTVRWESWMGFSMRIERVLWYGERVEWVFRWGLNGFYSTVREFNDLWLRVAEQRCFPRYLCGWNAIRMSCWRLA